MRLWWGLFEGLWRLRHSKSGCLLPTIADFCGNLGRTIALHQAGNMPKGDFIIAADTDCKAIIRLAYSPSRSLADINLIGKYRCTYKGLWGHVHPKSPLDVQNLVKFFH